MDDNRAASVGEGKQGGHLTRLLQRCGKGDRAAFRRLYDIEAPRLYGVALGITRNSALAEDAVHDALLQVWKNGARFDPDRGSAAGWLIGLVRYRAIDIVRRRKFEASEAEAPEQLDTAPDALDRMVATAEGRALRNCLEALDERKRRAIVLAFVEGLSHAELAERLETPVGTVKSWIRRGLIALKACLES